ncbi:hypothetical protein BC827DRAFT_1217597 [Russula dissimulans]|nr:hypothetical protein BC827DRAFT_1217597 [Russula dissimulans]
MGWEWKTLWPFMFVQMISVALLEATRAHRRRLVWGEGLPSSSASSIPIQFSSGPHWHCRRHRRLGYLHPLSVYSYWVPVQHLYYYLLHPRK